MPDPNSWLTKFRFAVVKLIEPGPELGEAWCIDCSLNDGLTLVIEVDGTQLHARSHVQRGNKEAIRMISSWPATRKEADEH